jgi:putative effector of murein hydrolase
MAVFVVVIDGALTDDMILACVPIVSALARGVLFGVGAHGAGAARARQIGETEGAVAGLGAHLPPTRPERQRLNIHISV